MQTNKNKLATLLTALGLTVGAGAASAAEIPQACQYRTPTAESYTWDFSSEATELFQEVERRADRIQTSAAELDAFTRGFDLLSWEAHAIELEKMRLELNAIGEDACRLARIRRVVEPEQQRMIDRIRLRAANLEKMLAASIDQFNEWPQRTKAQQDYAERVDRMYVEAGELEDAAEGLASYESAD